MKDLSPDNNNNKIVVKIEKPWKVSRGHLAMPRCQTHKDKRQQSRVNEKSKFKKGDD